MKVYVSESDRNKKFEDLSYDVYHAIMDAMIARLDEILDMPNQGRPAFDDEIDLMRNAKIVSEFDDLIDIEYLPEKLTFYIFNNLRCQQDGTVPEVKRFDRLEDAIEEYNSLPKEYTTALGGCLGDMHEIDFVHRRNGESVLVTDYRNMDPWANNGFVKQAIRPLIRRLIIEYESDITSLGTHCPVLIPVSQQEEINSYYKDKYLYPKFSHRLLSAVNEVYEEGEGWIKFEDFYQKVGNISPSKETYRPKVTKYNISYIDSKGRTGQADISPTDFAFMKKQTEERFYQHPKIDKQIQTAEKQSKKPPSKDKNIDRKDR